MLSFVLHLILVCLVANEFISTTSADEIAASGTPLKILFLHLCCAIEHHR